MFVFGCMEGVPKRRNVNMTLKTYKNDIVAARIFGAAFIAAFFTYGVGNAVIDGFFAATDPSSEIQNGNVIYACAIFSVVVLHTLANVASTTVMFTITKPFSRFASLSYLVLALLGTVCLVFGGLLLALAPAMIESHGTSSPLIALLSIGNFYAYQAGMSLWGIGGFIICLTLFKARLIPKWMCIWGMAAYVVFAVGTMSELFGSGLGITLSIPGGLFEITLALWLIFKGFDYSQVEGAAA